MTCEYQEQLWCQQMPYTVNRYICLPFHVHCNNINFIFYLIALGAAPYEPTCFNIWKWENGDSLSHDDITKVHYIFLENVCNNSVIASTHVHLATRTWWGQMVTYHWSIISDAEIPAKRRNLTIVWFWSDQWWM